MSTTIQNNAKKILQQLGFKLSGSVESIAVLITPDIAKLMLSTSVGNRALKENQVRNLINCIKNDDFVLTNNAISFDDSHYLRDGHHRLTAIVRANKPVTSFVSTGINEGNFLYVDRGVNRSMSDTLQLSSKVDFEFNVNKNTVAVANFLIRIHVENYEKNLNCKFVESVLYANKEGIKFSEEHFSAAVRSINNAGTRSAITCASESVDKERLAVFCKIVLRGAGFKHDEKSNAALMLRDFLLAPHATYSRLGISKTGGFTAYKVCFMATQHCIRSFMNDAALSKLVVGVTRDKESNQLIFKEPLYRPKMPGALL